MSVLVCQHLLFMPNACRQLIQLLMLALFKELTSLSFDSSCMQCCKAIKGGINIYSAVGSDVLHSRKIASCCS